MQKSYSTTTDECFVTRDGKTVRYQEILEGIDRIVGSIPGLSQEEREDLFQEAALRVIRSRAGFDPERGFRCPQAYGAMVARNCAKDAYAKAGRRGVPLSSLEVEDEDGDTCVPIRITGYRGDEYEADRALAAEEVRAYVEEKLLSLNERYRTAIRLGRSGLKPRHMAVLLGCTPSVASLTLHRARKALRRALGAKFLSEYGLCA